LPSHSRICHPERSEGSAFSHARARIRRAPSFRKAKGWESKNPNQEVVILSEVEGPARTKFVRSLAVARPILIKQRHLASHQLSRCLESKDYHLRRMAGGLPIFHYFKTCHLMEKHESSDIWY
jgi:hypothetical protein